MASYKRSEQQKCEQSVRRFFILLSQSWYLIRKDFVKIKFTNASFRCHLTVEVGQIVIVVGLDNIRVMKEECSEAMVQ